MGIKILHTVEFYSPSVGGAQEVVKQVSEHLVKRGHEVTVATTRLPDRTESEINGVRVEEFDISGNAVRGFRGEAERYQKFLLDGEFDVMMNYAAQQWSADLVFPLLKRLPYRKVFIPCGFSGLFNPQYAEYFKQMPEVMRNYDRMIFTSYAYRDFEFAKQDGVQHCTIIPNGASEEEFRHVDPTFRERYGIPEDTPLLLTVGSHTGLKGHSLVIDAFRRASINRAVLVIIGNTINGRGCLPDCKRRALRTRVFSLGRKRVLLLDPPRVDVIAAYHAADLFVFGSNIECSPLVLFEAMASRTPFLTTACGNAEEIVNMSHGGVLVPTIQEANGMVSASAMDMAASIENVVSDPERLSFLGEAGYQAWQQQFTWERIAARYEHLYQSLVDDMAAGSVNKHDRG